MSAATPAMECTSLYCPVRARCAHWHEAKPDEPHRFGSWEREGCAVFQEAPPCEDQSA